MATSTLPASACPRCSRALERRRRSLLDRVRTAFSGKVRYRCAARCGWEGLIPRADHSDGRSRHVIGAAGGCH